MAKEYAKQFYNSKKWRRCRQTYIDKRIMIDGGLCEMCKELPGAELHHKIPININNISDTNITINFDNLIFLCKDCHFKVHKEEILKGFELAKKPKILNKNGVWFDSNGQPQFQKVYIVYGAPASGKTTYVKANKHPGDMVIDLDIILQALGLSDKESIPNNLLDVAIGIRDYLYDRIVEKSVDCKCIWVIACLPHKKQREELQKRFNAELIHIDVPMEVCVERAYEDKQRQNKLKHEFLIRKYFETYQA